MSIEKERLLALIEFSHHSARLRGKTAATVSAHGRYALYEHEIQGLPGINLNPTGPEIEDEIWLTVERLHETMPPIVESAILQPWIKISHGPTEKPLLRETTDGASLIKAGTHQSLEDPPEPSKLSIKPDAVVTFAEYEAADQVHAQFETYLTSKWLLWAKDERLRRKTISLYSQLFTLSQQLEGGIAEAQIELVWGVGIGIWNCNGTTVSYPLIGRLVELALDPVTAELEIRPRAADARLEIDWFASVGNLGVSDLEKKAKEFFSQATTTFSPFDRGTFEPLLRTAATNLDANGIYWPNEVEDGDRGVPKADANLKVTDTWVLFARPRTNSLFLQDLEKLKTQVKDADTYPPALTAIVTDPETTNPLVQLPPFRGVSASYHVEQDTSGKKTRDLYFPKPFNDEQVRIVQLLTVSDGVVVQGPPGTGKTHTIANIISHYLAEGKRVLVTSMKDPALAVLREQLPEEIRPLTISLLTSEQEGMKQFEHAINKIASEVQSLDRASTARTIRNLEESIDILHSKLAFIDRNISNWAKLNLNPIVLETGTIAPEDAAREVVQNAGQFEWIPDQIGITAEFAPQFSEADIVQLRESRRLLGEDIDYLDASLPQIVEFPGAKELIEVHHDLSQFEKLKKGVENGEVPSLSDSSQETLAIAQQLLTEIELFRRRLNEVKSQSRPWTKAIHKQLQITGNDGLFRTFEDLGVDLENAVEQQKAFLERPVNTPEGIELDTELIEAVRNLRNGKSPFGIKGWIGKSEKKKQLDGIRVFGNPPGDVSSWEHVSNYLDFLRVSRMLVSRWNALAPEIGFDPTQDNKPENAIVAAHEYGLYLKLKDVVNKGSNLRSAASRVFPNWAYSRNVAYNPERLTEMEKALRHHLTKNRLAKVWVTKERFQKVLEGRSGRIIEKLRRFVNETLGNPEIEDFKMQAEWSASMAELSRVLGLSVHLDIVGHICGMVEASGAPQYARLLKQMPEGTIDSLLPDNWRTAWRLRRLETHLSLIDAREDLKKLAKGRRDVESDLSHAYQNIVVKRTWLKLAENASPSIRAALQAYLNAIQKIGKGMGKRAVRYRQDARAAASLANRAVPCWIMAHYRVSESLPPELGCFDLVIIDEASQSDLTALPSLLRAKKVLIVGDDKQVSPEGVGLEEEKVRSLMNRFLASQVETYRPQMSPERSIYDLFKVVFAKSAIMLREHFRCVSSIIEYSKREFYNHELRPLRLPKSSERLDPPLIDVIVEDGYRDGDINLPEAHFIIDEISAIVADPKMVSRSIGVVSLLADKQALRIWELLTEEIGPEVMQRHRITCGDARTFQGKERDIMFLSMVSAPNYVGAPLSRDTFAQRFNVAASRARDRMYLVRSVEIEHLSKADRLRRGLITHFATPFVQDEARVEDLRKLCESPFEREMYDELTQRGYLVFPQVKVGQYRIDLVVEGHNDARLAVECDGDKYHGPDRWAEDMGRQRDLERAGWVFWRCFASTFIRRREAVLAELVNNLTEMRIEPIGGEGAPRSVHVERRVIVSSLSKHYCSQNDTELSEQSGYLPSEQTEVTPVPIGEAIDQEPNPQSTTYMNRTSSESEPSPLPGRSCSIGLHFSNYSRYEGLPLAHPNHSDLSEISDGLIRIIEVEGPVIVKRVYGVYLESCGIQRLGNELKKTMNKAMSRALRAGHLVSENEVIESGIIFSVVRVSECPPIKLRNRGPRTFEEIPPSELQVVARYLTEYEGFAPGSEEHLRAVLQHFDLKRLTTQVRAALIKIFEKRLPYVNDFINGIKSKR